MNSSNTTYHGFKFIKKGCVFLKQNKSLWVYAAIPFFINIILFFASIWFVAHYFPELFDWLISRASFLTLKGESFWYKLLIPVYWLIKTILFILFLIFSLITCFVIGMIISGPFNDLLSEKTERLLCPDKQIEEISFLKVIPKTVITELKKAIFFIGVPIFALLINLIPIIGTVFYIIIVNSFAVFDIGFAFIDYPMSRRNWSFKRRTSFAWKNKFAVCGLGTVVLIPLLPFIMNAPLVVGGTILFRRLSQFSEVQSSGFKVQR